MPPTTPLAFTENFAIKNNLIADSRTGNNIQIDQPNDYIVNIEGADYIVYYLNENGSNKGGNSIIMKLLLAQNFDFEDLNYESPDLILKIHKDRIKSPNPNLYSRGQKRFMKETLALDSCKKMKLQNVIEIYHTGKCSIKNHYNNRIEEYLYYTMEPAEYDLKNYLENTHRILDFESKLSLCLSLANGLKDVYDAGYYHRDIKPDNIFFVGNTWKIGDLGLVSERDGISELDRVADFIGPRGWISPEVMNKYLTESKGFEYVYDCKIDHQSDIFQLAKVYWYIFQFNAPIGTVKQSDFNIKNDSLFGLIKTMLNHSKRKRVKTIDEVIDSLKMIEKKALKAA